MHDGPERRKNPMQVFNIYPQMGPQEHAQLDRMERILGAVFRQNDTMLDLLVDLGNAPSGDPAKLAALAARVQAVRDTLANALTQNAPST